MSLRTDKPPVDSAAALAEQSIAVHTITDRSSRIVRDHQLWTTPVEGDPVWPLEGEFGVDALPGRLIMRRARARNRHDMCSRAWLAPGIQLVLLAAGTIDVRFGDRRLRREPAEAPRAAILHLREDTPFERLARRGTWEQSITVTLPPAWLARRLDPAPHPTARQGPAHLTTRTWQPSAELLDRMDSVFRDRAPADDGTRRLHCESVALAMAAEAGPMLGELCAAPAVVGAHERRVRRLQSVVESAEAVHMTREQIAEACGMSPTNLRRQFHALYGTSVRRFLRRRRLEAARAALREQAVRVSEAAELAGYSSPANFATAFRRQFGYSPSRLRQPVAGDDTTA